MGMFVDEVIAAIKFEEHLARLANERQKQNSNHKAVKIAVKEERK